MGSFSQSVMNVGGGMRVLLEKEYTSPSDVTTSASTVETVTLPEFDLTKYDLMVKTETLKERTGTSIHWLGSQMQYFYCGDVAAGSTSSGGRVLYQANGSTTKSASTTPYGLYTSNFYPSTKELSVNVRASNTYAPQADIAGAKAKLIAYLVPKPQ